MSSHANEIARLTDLLRRGDVVVFTGAGVSTEMSRVALCKTVSDSRA